MLLQSFGTLVDLTHDWHYASGTRLRAVLKTPPEIAQLKLEYMEIRVDRTK